MAEDEFVPAVGWAGRFRDRGLEDAFRRDSWSHQTADSRLLAVAGGAFFLLGFAVDYALVGRSRLLWWLLALRAATAVAIVVVTWWMTRIDGRCRRFDLGLLAIMLGAAASTCVIIAVSPGTLTQHAPTVLVILLVYYLFLPAKLEHVVIASITFSAAFLVVAAVSIRPTAGEATVVVLYLALVYVFGAVTVARAARSERREYVAKATLQEAHDTLVSEVSARARAEHALAESEARYRALVELSPDAIIVHRDGRVVYANPAAVRMVGLESAGDALGTSVFDVLLPEHRQQVEQRIARIQEHGQRLGRVEVGLQTTDGRTVYCEVVSGQVPFEGEPAVQSVVRDIGERHRLEDELRRLATTDSLTGVCNRRRFFEQLAVEWSRTARHAHQLSVLVIDLDRFKQVNDNFGHAVGDEVLCTAVERFRGCLRSSDTLGRLGGEEFAAVLPEIGEDGAVAAAERIRAAIAGEPVTTAAGPVSLTVSVGCAECRVGREDSDEALKRADDALYEAKRRGRNRVVVG